MGNVQNTLRYIGWKTSSLLNAPLRDISSDKKALGTKVASGLAIGILTVFSLGAYGVHAYKYFSKRKAINLQQTLEKAVEQGNCEQVKNLLDQHPSLTKKLDLRHVGSNRHISVLLSIAVESGNLTMVQLIRAKGATLENFSRGQVTPLERALLGNQIEIATYLVDEGAQIRPDALRNFMMKSGDNHELILHLIQKSPAISSADYPGSFINIMGARYSENPEKSKQITQLLIQKGDRPVEGDRNIEISDEARRLIDAEIAKIN
jgi:hypothetical protein